MRILGILVIMSAVALLAAACGGGAAPAQNAPAPTSPPVVAPTTAPAPVSTTTPSRDVEKVSLEDPSGSGAYKFGPSEFTFSVGDTITLELTSEGEFHTFTVDDLGIDVSVDAGQTETLTFAFDEAGTFDLICIPHEALGMVGTITVR